MGGGGGIVKDIRDELLHYHGISEFQWAGVVACVRDWMKENCDGAYDWEVWMDQFGTEQVMSDIESFGPRS